MCQNCVDKIYATTYLNPSMTPDKINAIAKHLGATVRDEFEPEAKHVIQQTAMMFLSSASGNMAAPLALISAYTYQVTHSPIPN